MLFYNIKIIIEVLMRHVLASYMLTSIPALRMNAGTMCIHACKQLQ